MKKFFGILLLLFVFVTFAVNCSRNDRNEVKDKKQLVGETSNSNKEGEEIQRQKEEEIAKLQERLVEPQPEKKGSAEEYFLAVCSWRENLYSFVLYRGRPESFEQNIERELEKRNKTLVVAIENYLIAAKGKPLPECQGIDPMYAVDNLWRGKLLTRELLMQILKVQTKTNLRRLHSDSWEEQESSRLYWRLIAGRYGLTKGELWQLGLRNTEIANILNQR